MAVKTKEADRRKGFIRVPVYTFIFKMDGRRGADTRVCSAETRLGALAPLDSLDHRCRCPLEQSGSSDRL